MRFRGLRTTASLLSRKATQSYPSDCKANAGMFRRAGEGCTMGMYVEEERKLSEASSQKSVSEAFTAIMSQSRFGNKRCCQIKFKLRVMKDMFRERRNSIC